MKVTFHRLVMSVAILVMGCLSTTLLLDKYASGGGRRGGDFGRQLAHTDTNWPLILMWTLKNGLNMSVSLERSIDYLSNHKCRLPYCRFTTDPSTYQRAHAIIFHLLDFEPGLQSLPPQRWTHQRYVFYNREPPTNHNILRKTRSAFFSHGFFNWTMTTRRDSDIYAPYVSFQRSPTVRNVTFSTEHKTTHAAWFVSRCSSHSRREEFVQELKKYINIDIYGKCGSLHCLKGKDKRCYKMLSKYHYYLAFENSYCNDYITEKAIFPMMYADIIPVVRGGVDYTTYLPPNSYIEADQFKSAKELGLFLVALSADRQAYNKFLMWKRTFLPVYSPNPLCTLCERLWEKPGEVKVYDNLDRWWNRGQCREHHDETPWMK